MEKLNEEIFISKKLKRHERIWFKLLKRSFIKVYNIGRIAGINKMLE